MYPQIISANICKTFMAEKVREPRRLMESKIFLRVGPRSYLVHDSKSGWVFLFDVAVTKSAKTAITASKRQLLSLLIINYYYLLLIIVFVTSTLVTNFVV